MKRYLGFLGMLVTSLFATVAMASAEAAAAAQTASEGGLIAIGAGVAIGIAILGATLGQGKAVGAALESIGRNPAAAGKIFTPMIIGLVFMEALGIFAFVIAFFLQNKI